jgi:outer membrane murein-binding lipoprotein Lpp
MKKEMTGMVTKTDFAQTLDLKADKTALNLKANITALELNADITVLNLKADKTALDLKADKTALAQTTQRLDETHTSRVESVKNKLTDVIATVENLKIDTDAGKFNQSRYIFVSHSD